MKRSEMSGKIVNSMKLTLPSYSVNEGVARGAVASFCAQLDPSAAELGDIKCALSEAVTNCIVHGYRDNIGEIYIKVELLENSVVKIPSSKVDYKKIYKESNLVVTDYSSAVFDFAYLRKIK